MSLRYWAFAVAIVVLFGEVAARYFVASPIDILRPSPDAKLLYELRPGHYFSDGYVARMNVVEYTIDERGCRLVEDSASPSGEAVLFLGGSFSFGLGVDSKSTLSEAARDELRRQDPSVDFVPLNCGIPGQKLLQTLHSAEKAIDAFDVKSIAIVILPHHGTVAYDWTRREPSSSVLRWLTAHVRLVRLGHLVYIARQAGDFDVTPVSPDELGAAFDRLASAVKAKGVRVVIFPIDEFLHPEFPIVPELEKRGLRTASIKAPPRDSRYRLSDGNHWNAEGIRFIAEQMTPSLSWLAQERTARAE